MQRVRRENRGASVWLTASCERLLRGQAPIWILCVTLRMRVQLRRTRCCAEAVRVLTDVVRSGRRGRDLRRICRRGSFVLATMPARSIGPASGFASVLKRWCILTPLPDSMPRRHTTLKICHSLAPSRAYDAGHHALVLAITSHLRISLPKHGSHGADLEEDHSE